jgi:hypothetical protein
MHTARKATSDLMPEGARLALIYFVNNRPWFETTEATPHDRADHERSFRHTVGWLVAHGYAIRRDFPQRPDGTRSFATFALTPIGQAERHRLMAELELT